ncbi:MAG: UPF0182 family protein [Nitrosopumilaceae archaeon]
MILYRSSTEDSSPSPDAGRYVRIGLAALIGIVIFVIVGNQAVTLFMNVSEFGDLFTKPLLYSILSALILASIVLIRVNIRNRSSIAWYVIHTAITFLKKGDSNPITANITSFRDYRLSIPNFVVWQITKVLLFGALFSNLMFGFAVQYLLEGNNLGIESIWGLFSLPFVTPPTDPSYALERIVPMIPTLTVIVPPILAAIGLRLVLYVGLHSIIRVVTNYVYDVSKGKPRFLDYIATIEGIIGIGILWGGINMFFTNQIDYNTRYAIGGTLATGFGFIVFYFMDKYRSKVITQPSKRDIYVRVLTILAIAVIAGAIMAVNNSIADAKKIEYLGPYKAQQIGVNRYLGQLGEIRINSHDVKLESVSPNNIKNYIMQNEQTLNNIRVWDWDAAFAKLKPEIGLIPYVNFEDNDILRFNDRLYWTASIKPVLPESVSLENRWYNEHLVYTHVPNGFLTLEASNGTIIDSSKLFTQRSIYYGEGGLFHETWSAYPTERGDTTAELNNAFYAGKGGLDVAPPLSQIFEPNFLLSYPTEPIHIMRYRDIQDRMETLYPYFQYNLFGQEVDSLPVTDGQRTYWLVPLIVGFDTHDVPWTVSNPYLRLVGYALVDTYDGKITLIKTGDDFFTNIFVSQYADKFIETPAWLEKQIKYPEELFNWKVEMYNIYHVTDTSTFIQAKEFYEVPEGLGAYYIQAKPPGFDESTYVGLLSLELRGSQGRNLAGFMVVENDLKNLGKMQFYQVPLDSETKLLGPTAVREALDRDPDFAQLKTLLRNPRIGDNILYRISDHDVYFIPVYTAGSGGVVTQLGTIAAVGAAFDGEYYVGMGNTPQQAFEAYLAKLSGVAPSITGGFVELDKDTRIETLKSLFQNENIKIVSPTSVQIPLSFEEGKTTFFQESDLEETKKLVSKFIDDFVKPRTDRVIVWETGNTINFGSIVFVENVPEMHYISIEVGK